MRHGVVEGWGGVVMCTGREMGREGGYKRGREGLRVREREGRKKINGVGGSNEGGKGR